MIYSTPVDDVYDSGSLRPLPLGLRMAWDRGEGDDGLLSSARGPATASPALQMQPP